MKKLFAILSLIFGLTFYSFSQNEVSIGKIEIGVYNGLIFSNLYNANAPHKFIVNSDNQILLGTHEELEKTTAYYDYSHNVFKGVKSSYNIGMSINYKLTPKLSIMTGLGWESKGVDFRQVNTNWTGPSLIFTDTVATSEFAFNHNEFKTSITNHYIVIPLRFSVVAFPKIGYFVSFGGYVGFLVNSTKTGKVIKTDFEYHAENGSFNQDIKGNNKFSDISNNYINTSKLDFGLSFGNGFRIRLSEHIDLISELLINLGLHKLDRKYNNDYNESFIRSGYTIVTSGNYNGFNSNSKNISLAINFGLSYKL